MNTSQSRRGQGRLAIGAVLLAMAGATGAEAGGLERGGYNIDLLFDPADYAAEAAVTYVNPNRDFHNAEDINPANGLGSNGIGGGATSVRDTEDYFVPRIGAKVGFGDSIDCMADYSQPWGIHVHPGADWVGANENIETKVRSDNYAATCSYSWALSRGQIRVIGGGFYQEVSGFKERLVVGGLQQNPALAGFTGTGRLDLEGNGWGWRAGLGYEIPDIALQTSLVYNSEVDLGTINGTLDLTEIPSVLNPANPLFGRVTDVYGTAIMPQSLEWKVQTGVAPNWLVFGSVKWTDWSSLQIISFCPTSTKALAACRAGGPTEATSLDLLYRDGWTVTGGVGHRFNDQWSGAVSLTWDRGTSTGITSQTDTWTLGTGLSYAPTKNVEFRLAGAVGILTSGEVGPKSFEGRPYGDDVRYDFGNDVFTAISTSLKVKF
ncbi:OmpP1/FadL family transporter [Rhizobium sp. CC-YZS058]|uniref:OmpP1/FadL family transporter n=1 Tax=Rhizobium sp. CC-YZS058 TaxID=3042153 RepID=UPI002B052FAD|nr:OmpP1/FadL family transporter [Rhizobium sp. CC-YZS058]MEA3534781.1 OmpP1/FadL family transporter [Rhizobium sp. CC-YZS058]